jgi:hypothetical protein
MAEAVAAGEREQAQTDRVQPDEPDHRSVPAGPIGFGQRPALRHQGSQPPEDGHVRRRGAGKALP